MDLLEVVYRGRNVGYNDEEILNVAMIIKQWDTTKECPNEINDLYEHHRKEFQMIMADRGNFIFQSCNKETIESIFNYFDSDWLDQFLKSRGYKNLPPINV